MRAAIYFQKREIKKINSTNILSAPIQKCYCELCHIIGYTHAFEAKCKQKSRLT